MDELMKLTHNEGVDLVMEMLANVNLGPSRRIFAMYFLSSCYQIIEKDVEVLASRGRVVVIGSRGNSTINARSAPLDSLHPFRHLNVMLW